MSCVAFSLIPVLGLSTGLRAAEEYSIVEVATALQAQLARGWRRSKKRKEQLLLSSGVFNFGF